MITISDVGEMVAHFKMLTKEFPKRTEQNKERYNQIKFPSQRWKKRHRNTERAIWHFFVRCFSNVWRKCCLSVLECSDTSLGFSWLNACLSVEIKQLHFLSAQKKNINLNSKFIRTYIGRRQRYSYWGTELLSSWFEMSMQEISIFVKLICWLGSKSALVSNSYALFEQLQIKTFLNTCSVSYSVVCMFCAKQVQWTPEYNSCFVKQMRFT